jgi:hypothetical protein
MRTVTFSDPSVVDALEEFVVTWFNYQPGFHSCEGGQEIDILDRSPHVFPTRNWYSLFLTPNGEVLHMLPGYWEPEEFLQQLRFVFSVWRQAKDRAAFARAHRDRVAWLGGRIRDAEEALKKLPFNASRLPSGGGDGARLAALQGPRRDFTSEELRKESERRLAGHTHDRDCAIARIDGLKTLRRIHEDRARKGAERLTNSFIAGLPAGNSFLDFSSSKMFKTCADLERELNR